MPDCNVTVTQANTSAVQVERSPSSNIVVYERGLQGPKGNQGDPGISGAGLPFSPVDNTSDIFYTTSSLQPLGKFTSSLVPVTGSNLVSTHNLGSLTHFWGSTYSSQFVATEAFGIIRSGSFDPIIIRNGDYTKISVTGSISVQYNGIDDIISVYSGSLETIRVNTQGLVTLAEYDYTPLATRGALLFSGSDLFLGL